MTRSRASAKQAGTRAESAVARFLAERLDDDRIERRRLSGNKDVGDVGGVRHLGRKVVIEVKDVVRTALAQWVAEAEVERVNDGALAGVVWHKRVGTTDPGRWYVTMTGDDFVAFLKGER